jgi:outer membrane protein assembly factor BamB
MKKWILLIFGAAAGAFGADWHTWHGPDANGISRETGVNGAAAKIAWTADLGAGYSAVSVKDGRLYTMGNLDEQDRVYCLDAKTGKEIWSHSYACAPGRFKGPRATPVVVEDAVYTVSREGQVFCFDAVSGEVKWSTDVLNETGVENIRWGISSSVVAEGDLLLLGIGEAGVALRRKDGAVAWKSRGSHSYATPVVFDQKGRRVAAVFSAPGLKLVDVGSGEVVGGLDWETKYEINGADPVRIGDKLFISSGYGRGGALVDAARPRLKILWENDRMKNHFSSSIHLDGYLYGMDGQAKGKSFLRCLSVEDGSEQWSVPLDHGSLIAADGQLIVLEENGILHFADATPAQYRERSTFDTGLGRLCWTAPVLANGLLYCRNDDGRLAAIHVK